MTATKEGCNNDPGTAKFGLNFNAGEIRYLKQSWEMATSTMDIGCELVARLLNDNRTRFRALIETHSGDLLGSANFSAEDVKKIRRARAVGNGVAVFFNQVMGEIDDPNASDLIAERSQRLGAAHFQMKVWFQAENWLCVKNCLLETIMAALALKKKGPLFCWQHVMSMDTKKGRECWYKVIHFVIQNMKKGFLAEALSADTSSSNDSAASR
ncbi:hypothetical protein V3C99_010034 [Haemonchus contortus]